MKKMIAIIAALSMIMTMAACGGTTAPAPAPAPAPAAPAAPATPEASKAPEAPAAPAPAEGKTVKVGVAIYQFDDNFMTLYRTELEKYLTEGGLGDGNKYEVTIVDGKNDQATQTEQIKTFIAQKMDVLILNLVQTSSADVIINLVKEAGIPTVLINREPEAAHLALFDKLSYVGADASQSGTFQGEIILETPNKGDINGDGTVSYVMIQGDPENVDAKLRTEYSIKALTDAGMKVEQLDMQRGDWKQERGQEIAATDLAKFGEKVEVIFCNNDGMALGAYQAIQAAGRTVGKDIYLVGVDALPECQEMVKAGTMTGTVLNDHVAQSHKAAEVLGKLVAGEKVDSKYIVDYAKITK